MKIAVIGAGSWGTALAVLIANGEREISLWGRSPELMTQLKHDRENRRYLTGIKLPEQIDPTHNLVQALEDAAIVILAVPSGAMRQILEESMMCIPTEALLISAAKGLEENSGLRMSQTIAQILPGSENRIVALSGPNLSLEVARGVPTASVAASISESSVKAAQALFTNTPQSSFRVYTSSDLVGVELGGAIKNMIAIGAGICDGLGYGDNSKAALMTRGLTEAMRLGLSLGAEASTFMGLSGVGDLIATGASRLSRNYRVGLEVGHGRQLNDILSELGQVAEGVPTTNALNQLASKHHVDMPLCSALYSVLYECKDPMEVIQKLMLRPAGEEHNIKLRAVE